MITPSLLHVSDVIYDLELIFSWLTNFLNFRTTTNRTSEGNRSLEGSDLKRMRRHMQENTFKVELSWVRKYPLSDLIKVLIGDESDRYQDVLRVLDIILRQRSVKQ